jgi:hypothetical protein
MTYKITNWKTGATIHEYGETAKDCLENGVESGISFNNAELNCAELNYAKLNYAKLNNAKLNYAELNYAKLNNAELNYAKLNNAKLNNAKLNYAKLNYAELNNAKLNNADTHSIKYEFFGKLALQYNEIAGLRAAIVEGKIDGATYEGECACFVGTIANVAHTNYENLAVQRNPDSLTERWFLAISKDDTPETNPISKITLNWIDEFLLLTNIPAKKDAA